MRGPARMSASWSVSSRGVGWFLELEMLPTGRANRGWITCVRKLLPRLGGDTSLHLHPRAPFRFF